MKQLCLLFALSLLLNTINAQDIKLQPMFMAINVSNIDSSIQWYTNTFDLKLRNRVDNKERGFKQAILFNETTMVELVELVKSISADTLLKQQPQGTRVNGFTKFGFVVSHIDTWYQQLAAANIKLFGSMVADPISKKKTFLIRDPDNNLIQFFEE